MKSHDLFFCGSMLSVDVCARPHNLPGESQPLADGEITSSLPRETCPSCGKAACCNDCDGSQGADEENKETAEEAIDRQRYNAFLDAIESITLAHACAGINISDPAYVEGLETAMQAAGSNS